MVNILPKTVVNKPDFKEKYADSIAYFVDRSFKSPSDDAGIKFDGDNSETANVVSSKFGLYTTSYYNRAGKPIVRYLTGGTAWRTNWKPYPSFDDKAIETTPDSIPDDKEMEPVTKIIMNRTDLNKKFQVDSSVTLATGLVRTHIRYRSEHQPKLKYSFFW